MPNIDFDVARRERLRRDDPLTFTLGNETFRCREGLGLADAWGEPADPPKNIIDGANTDIARTFMRVAQDITMFLERDEYDRWWALFTPDSDEIIQGRDLIDILNHLSEEYTGRPTSPSDDSSNGQPDGGTGSTSSSEPAATD